MKKEYSFKKQIKQIWNFIWNDDSIYSWVINILLAFLIIKFLLYPGLGLLLGTNLPVVAVISESMDHKMPFDEWWGETSFCNINSPCPYSQGSWYLEHNISKEQFKDFKLHKGFVRGDVISLKGVKPEDINVGDVIVYDAKLPYPIIHRVIEINKEGDEFIFTTKGDHNPYPINSNTLNETNIHGSQVRGKAQLRIPFVGYVRLLAADLVNFILSK